MNPTLFVAYEDLKTLSNNIPIKSVLFSVFLIAVLPYLVLARVDFLGSRIQSATAVLLVALQLFVPYIAMRMSYKSISGEIATNNHRLLLTFPISRLNLVVGKWMSRSLAMAASVVLYAAVSVVVSTVVYESMMLLDAAWITTVTMLLAPVFCAIGVAVSCRTKSDSIVAEILVAIIYIPFVLGWRTVPFLVTVLTQGGGVNELPPAEYSSLDYLFLRLNPLESHASLVSSGISSDINIYIPSTLRVPDLAAAQFVNYSATPVDPADVALYAQEIITIPLSVLLPFGLLAYGYWKLRNREL